MMMAPCRSGRVRRTAAKRTFLFFDDDHDDDDSNSEGGEIPNDCLKSEERVDSDESQKKKNGCHTQHQQEAILSSATSVTEDAARNEKEAIAALKQQKLKSKVLVPVVASERASTGTGTGTGTGTAAVRTSRRKRKGTFKILDTVDNGDDEQPPPQRSKCKCPVAKKKRNLHNQEAATTTATTATTTGNIIEPHDNDVLFGRGGTTLWHPGNVRFRYIIRQHKDFSSTCRKILRRPLAIAIVELLQKLDPPGRFLEINDQTGYYEEVPLPRVIDKILKALQETRWVDLETYDTSILLETEHLKVDVSTLRHPDTPESDRIKPHDHDVLFGRGRGAGVHPGNVRFCYIIRQHKDFYSMCKKELKTPWAMSIIEMIRKLDPPGRFLDVNGQTGYYEEMPLPRVIDKILQALGGTEWAAVAAAAETTTAANTAAAAAAAAPSRRRARPLLQVLIGLEEKEKETVARLSCVPNNGNSGCEGTKELKDEDRKLPATPDSDRIKPHGQKEKKARPPCVPNRRNTRSEETNELKDKDKNLPVMPISDRIKPHDHDVLLGRGGRVVAHPGNVRFRYIIRQHKDFSSTCKKKLRTLLAFAIIDLIRKLNPPGRFLDAIGQTGYYEEAPLPRVIDKILQALRCEWAATDGFALDSNENTENLRVDISKLRNLPEPLQPLEEQKEINQRAYVLQTSNEDKITASGSCDSARSIATIATTGAGAVSDKNADSPSLAANSSTAKEEKKLPALPPCFIIEPHDHDVLLGKGGDTALHPGNLRYNRIVRESLNSFLKCNGNKEEQTLLAMTIVESVRNLDPPGRFLEIHNPTGYYKEPPLQRVVVELIQALKRVVAAEAAAIVADTEAAARTTAATRTTADAGKNVAASVDTTTANGYERQLPPGDIVHTNASANAVQTGALIAVYSPRDRKHHTARVLYKQNQVHALLLFYGDCTPEWINLRNHSFGILPSL